MEMSSGEGSQFDDDEIAETYSTFFPIPIDDLNLWFLRNFPKVSLKGANDHAVRLSHNLKNRRHGILKARSPYAPFEGHLGEEFKPVWEEGRIALFNLSNRCFISATRDGQLYSDCNTSSPGPHELFDVESRDQLVAFRSAHGTYIGIEAGGEKLICSATTIGPNELFQLRIKAFIQDNNGNYVAAERNNSLVTQRFRPGLARGDCFIVELGASRCSFRSQYNRYWVAESNGNISAATPANSNRKSSREEFALEGYRNDELESEHVYFAIRTTHGAFVISESDKIVTVSSEAIAKNIDMNTRSGGCFTDHLFDLLPQPSPCNSSPSSSSFLSSSAEFHRTPTFIAWAKNSLPPHGLTGSGPVSPPKREGDQGCTSSSKDSPEESLRNRIGARLRQHMERKAGRRRRPQRIRIGAETDEHKSAKGKGRINITLSESGNNSKSHISDNNKSNVFPNRSKSLSDHLERTERDGFDTDATSPRSDPLLKRADTIDFPVDRDDKRRSSSKVSKSSESLGSHDRNKKRDAIQVPKRGSSCGSPMIERADRRDLVEDREDSFERIEVTYVEDMNEDIEDGWWEISSESGGDYEYRTSERSKTPLSPRKKGSQSKKKKEGEPLSPRGAHLSDKMEEWIIDPRDLQLSDRVLGKGFFGEVKKGRWRGTPVAVKIIYREVFRSRSDEQLFEKEVSMLRSLHHPHVIQFLGVCHFKEKRQRCIVTELMKKGSLHDLLHNEPHLFKDPSLPIRIARDIAKGMCYLHMSDPPTLHRDLSSKNVLIDRFLRAKIADFGLSRLKEDSGVFTQGCGALAFMAPEVYRGETYSEKADVYSYAIILWEMWNMGRYPHEVAWMDQLAYAAECALRDYRPQLTDQIPEPWRQLIALCWHKNPSARPSFSQILNILKQIERINKGGKSGVEYLDLGEYMAEALLLDESTAHDRSFLPYSRDPQRRDEGREMPRGSKQGQSDEAKDEEESERSDKHKEIRPSEGEESEDEAESGYWSDRKIEQRLKKAELHNITPRAAKPLVGRGSEGRRSNSNYLDQDLRPPPPQDDLPTSLPAADDAIQLAHLTALEADWDDAGDHVHTRSRHQRHDRNSEEKEKELEYEDISHL